MRASGNGKIGGRLPELEEAPPTPGERAAEKRKHNRAVIRRALGDAIRWNMKVMQKPMIDGRRKLSADEHAECQIRIVQYRRELRAMTGSGHVVAESIYEDGTAMKGIFKGYGKAVKGGRREGRKLVAPREETRGVGTRAGKARASAGGGKGSAPNGATNG